MSTFYAFCRIADDIVDEKQLSLADGTKKIAVWRKEIDACYKNEPATELGKELAEIIHHHKIPKHLFEEILNGVEMDLIHKRYEDFHHLKKYCYRVASAVGLVSIKIFGCRETQSEDYAVALGMAFQLTNILRDVKYDLEEYGRIYLPQDEMKAFGVTEDDLRNNAPNCKKLFRMMVFRAEHFYNRAKRLIHPQDKKSLSAALIMTEVYHSLLEKIRKNDFAVLTQKISLTKNEKLRAVARALLKFHFSREKKTKTPPLNIAVWGGGIAGFSSALHLAQAGHHVDLYESKAYFGGRAHSFRDAKTGEILDNGQHIFMGCYHACMKLLDMLGAREKLQMDDTLKLYFYSAKHHECSGLVAPKWPEPLHLIAALFRFSELNASDRASILFFGILMRLGLKPHKKTTVAAWLKSWKQTDGAIRALWEPLCLAALNEPISTACSKLFYEVVKRALFGSRHDSAVYISKVGLSELFIPEAKLFLESIGGNIFQNRAIREIKFSDHHIQSFTTSAGETVEKDTYVSALPWTALSSLLPRQHPLREQIQQIHSAPIVGIYLWTDMPLIDVSVVGLLDSPIQWIFNRTIKTGEYLYAIVISGAYQQVDRSPKQILDTLMSELKRNFPKLSKMQIKHNFIYKALDATFAARPETNRLRPPPRTSFDNLFLAGDWTDTSLPSTMEGAALSGENVVKAIENV